MGRSLVRAALIHDDRVCAIGQSHSTDTPESMRSLHLTPPSGTVFQESVAREKNYIPLLCDVRVRSTVSSAFQVAQSHFGCIDIVANCSGHGIIGACEDQSEADIRNQFETNFMGTLNIIQLSLPHFREQQGGRYVIFSSTSGALGVPGLGPYCATKYAVEGLIESMLYEVDGFGIKATLVVGGHMRRDELQAEEERSADRISRPHHRSHRKSESGSGGLPDAHLKPFQHFQIKPASGPYASATSPAGHFKRMVQWIGDNQPTSAIKSAELIWQLGHCSFPPLRLLLGSYAVESIRDRLRSIIEEIEDWKHLGFAAVEVDTEMPAEGSGQPLDGVGGDGEEERDGLEDGRQDGEEIMQGS
jgi:NAD(P)-dependent dehydrogenase (short-subunit alcohol dehydrogenase family)